MLEYEGFPSQDADGAPYSAIDDEGHFYAECSNRGRCLRFSGECECFDGFSGHACQRGESKHYIYVSGFHAFEMTS